MVMKFWYIKSWLNKSQKQSCRGFMALKTGLVGLPNVGKSTLFNALTKSSIPASNYPFCTVDPNIAITNVPDSRLDQLAQIFGSKKIIPTSVQFVDIAGLVKGASEGEGLGNQFLGHIMDVHLILHVLRCFDDSRITHVHNAIDPIEDFEAICTELMLKDLDAINKRKVKVEGLLKTAKNKQATAQQIKDWETELVYMEKIIIALNRSDMPSVQKLAGQAAAEHITLTQLLSSKNFLIIANMSENEYSNKQYEQNPSYKLLIEKFGQNKVIPVSAKIESELAQMTEAEATEMMESLEISEKGLDSIISKAYSNLHLITFFTCGPKEAHAWSLKKDTKVPQAAGEIHSDFERGFICADVYNCEELFELGSEHKIKDVGKMRTEGREYIVQDGDILNIKFNV
jgi:ribosome-binding ATPase